MRTTSVVVIVAALMLVAGALVGVLNHRSKVERKPTG